MTITREQWASDALLSISKPVSVNNLKSVVCWESSENTQALFNPCASTLQYEGSNDFNEAGVKNYATYEEGLAAWKATILNGLYSPILECFDRSASMAETCSAIENSAWGSKPNSELQAEVATNYDSYANIAIPGTGGESEPPANVPVDTPNLEIGSSGVAVEELQSWLDYHANQHLAADGFFGELTKLAVQNLQRIMGLTVDGIVGPQTRAAMSYIEAHHAGPQNA